MFFFISKDFFLLSKHIYDILIMSISGTEITNFRGQLVPIIIRRNKASTIAPCYLTHATRVQPPNSQAKYRKLVLDWKTID